MCLRHVDWWTSDVLEAKAGLPAPHTLQLLGEHELHLRSLFGVGTTTTGPGLGSFVCLSPSRRAVSVKWLTIQPFGLHVRETVVTP